MRLIDADELKASLRESYFELKGIRDGLNGEHDRNVAEGQMVSFIEAILRVKNAPTIEVPRWVSVTERLPEPEKEVLAYCEQRPSRFAYVCCAFYVPQKWHSEESNYSWDYECCSEYDEETDDYIVNEGWYERIRNWDDYNAVGIADFVTHWMPLPEAPKDGDT